MSTMTVKAGPLGNMSDYILETGATLARLITELVKSGVDVAGRQPFIQGAKVAQLSDGSLVDPVLEAGQMVTFNGKLKGN